LIVELRIAIHREGWEQGGEMTQALYAYMNNKIIKKKEKEKKG
jgi:hypothetical protein